MAQNPQPMNSPPVSQACFLQPSDHHTHTSPRSPSVLRAHLCQALLAGIVPLLLQTAEHEGWSRGWGTSPVGLCVMSSQ